MLDAKVELDGRLRTVIGDFTRNFAVRTTASLPTEFPEKRNIEGESLISPICLDASFLYLETRGKNPLFMYKIFYQFTE